MRHLQSFPRTTWLGYVAALGAVGVVTGLIAVLVGRLPIANVSMLYLIAILATAVACGSGPAVLASVAALITFDWFFLDAQYTFVVASPSEMGDLLRKSPILPHFAQILLGFRSRAAGEHAVRKRKPSKRSRSLFVWSRGGRPGFAVSSSSESSGRTRSRGRSRPTRASEVSRTRSPTRPRTG